MRRRRTRTPWTQYVSVAKRRPKKSKREKRNEKKNVDLVRLQWRGGGGHPVSPVSWYI